MYDPSNIEWASETDGLPTLPVFATSDAEATASGRTRSLQFLVGLCVDCLYPFAFVCLHAELCMVAWL